MQYYIIGGRVGYQAWQEFRCVWLELVGQECLEKSGIWKNFDRELWLRQSDWGILWYVLWVVSRTWTFKEMVKLCTSMRQYQMDENVVIFFGLLIKFSVLSHKDDLLVFIICSKASN